MAMLVVRLDPRQLSNPDADIRYVLPDLLAEQSGGLISDAGYDYVGQEPMLMLSLEATSVEPALACIVDVIENVRVLDNDLHLACVVAVEREGKHDVVYPLEFVGSFLPA